MSHTSPAQSVLEPIASLIPDPLKVFLDIQKARARRVLSFVAAVCGATHSLLVVQIASEIMDEVLESLIMNCVTGGAKAVLTMLDELPAALGISAVAPVLPAGGAAAGGV